MGLWGELVGEGQGCFGASFNQSFHEILETVCCQYQRCSGKELYISSPIPTRKGKLQAIIILQMEYSSKHESTEFLEVHEMQDRFCTKRCLNLIVSQQLSFSISALLAAVQMVST